MRRFIDDSLPEQMNGNSMENPISPRHDRTRPPGREPMIAESRPALVVPPEWSTPAGNRDTGGRRLWRI
jgi:hypothetical protein